MSKFIFRSIGSTHSPGDILKSGIEVPVFIAKVGYLSGVDEIDFDHYR